MATDDKMIAATLAAALLNKQAANDQVVPTADHLVKLYFECLEALHAERQRRVMCSSRRKIAGPRGVA